MARAPEDRFASAREFHAAILAWGLGGLPAETLAKMRGTAWAFALCFAAIAVVSWKYLFVIPIAFSSVIALCLIAAALLSSGQDAGRKHYL